MLRGYQTAALGMALTKKHGTLVLPTATGKTVIGGALIKNVNQGRPGFRWLVVVPQVAILDRWIEELPTAGLFFGGEKTVKPVTITTYQSGIRYPELIADFDGVIFDEDHHGSAPLFRQLFEWSKNKEYVIGLTATFERLDGEHEIAEKYVPVIYTYKVDEARKDGSQSELNLKVVNCRSTTELETSVRKMNEIIGTALELHPNIYSWPRLHLWDAFRALATKKQLLSTHPEKLRALVHICKTLHPNERIIVFTGTIEAANMAEKLLREADVTARAYHSKSAKKLIDDTKRDGFKEWGKEFNVLISIGKLNEGIDVPEAKIGVIVHCSKSELTIIQRAGRIMRPGPTAATMYLLIATNTSEEQLPNLVENSLKLEGFHVNNLQLI